MKPITRIVLSFCLSLVLLGVCHAAPTNSQLKSKIKQLGQSAANGSLESVDTLADIAADLNSRTGPSRSMIVTENKELLAPAFDAMEKSAGRGNTKAFDALSYSLGKTYLNSSAAKSMGELAADGHKAALATLLDYKAKGILLSTATISLQRAAEKNIPEAVEFMIEIIEGDKSKALWRIASNGLRSAAAKGNLRAQAAIKKCQDELKEN